MSSERTIADTGGKYKITTKYHVTSAQCSKSQKNVQFWNVALFASEAKISCFYSCFSNWTRPLK